MIRRHAGQMRSRSPRQVGFAPAAVQLDVDRLEELAAAGDWAAAAELVAGEFLEGFVVPDATGFEDWLAAEREHWRGRSVEVLVRCADQLTRAGPAQEAAAVAGARAGDRPDLGGGAPGGASEPFARRRPRRRARAGRSVSGPPGRDRPRARADTSALVERVRASAACGAEVPTACRRPAIVRPPLAGRAEELARLLDAAARSARTGRAALVLVEGEPGVGKSRLLDEMLALLRFDGTAVASARAVEGDRGDPWSGVLAIARGGLLDAQGVAGAPPSALAALAAVLPEWAERFPGAGSSDEMPLGRALTESVRAAAADQPVVLAVDDAQWLDHDSALALGTMLRDLHAAPLTLVLATAAFPAAGRSRRAPEPGRTRPGGRRGAAPAAGPRRASEPGRADAAGLRPDLARSRGPASGHRLRRASAVRDRAASGGGARPGPGTIAGTWPEPLRTMDQSLPGDLPDAVVAAIRVAYRRLSPWRSGCWCRPRSWATSPRRPCSSGRSRWLRRAGPRAR